jgi:hypothetical protein
MLEAVNHGPRFTISLKRSTQNLQLSTTTPADYRIYWLTPIESVWEFLMQHDAT